MELDNEVLEVFREDLNTKRLIGRSANARTTKSKGKISDVAKGGEVSLMSLYDTVMPFTDFQKLTKQ